MTLFRLWWARRLLKRSRWHMREADRLLAKVEAMSTRHRWERMARASEGVVSRGADAGGCR